jgi:hypothetical protein
MPSSQATLELDFDIANSKEEVQISDKLIKDYQELNEKIDQTLLKIKSKRNKLSNNLKK